MFYTNAYVVKFKSSVFEKIGNDMTIRINSLLHLSGSN